jgi:hypothetical protein
VALKQRMGSTDFDRVHAQVLVFVCGRWYESYPGVDVYKQIVSSPNVSDINSCGGNTIGIRYINLKMSTICNYSRNI